MSKTILVLGASYAGLTVAHTLLKKTFATVKGYKLILVSPTTDFYYNTASVRAIVPGQFSDDKIFSPIAPGFSKYPAELFEFVLGTATSLDPAAKSVTVKTASETKTINYEFLVIATGSRATSALPWKNSPEGTEVTKEILHNYQEKVKAAKTIAIGGGGPTGVETSAEIAFEYKKDKEVTLYNSADEILVGSLPTHIAKVAESELNKLGVNIVKGTKVTSYEQTADGKTELTLSNGEKRLVDLYLPTVGVLPNTDFIPKTYLNERSEVMVDEFLRVKDAENIWAAGDVIDIEPSQFIYADKQATHCVKNIDLVLKGKSPVAYKYGGDRIMGVSLGRSKATGRSGNMKIPSVIIWWVKGRTLGTENLQKYALGTKF